MKSGGLKAFTLIELSIVLVVIGLIVGGVLVGQDLIKAARLRSAGTAVERVNTAVQTFKAKYDCLPGDCATATNYFPARSDCDPGDNVAVFEDNTCNGNGDGNIGGGTSNTDWAVAESFLLWQHLSDAKLVTGLYTGKAGLAFNDTISAQNVMALESIHAKGVLDVFYYNSLQQSNQVAIFSGAASTGLLNKHLIQLGMSYGNGLSRSGDLIFSSNEARALDSKIDDGNGLTGIMRGTTYAGACQDTSGNYLNSNAVSGMQSGQLGCSLYIKASF